MKINLTQDEYRELGIRKAQEMNDRGIKQGSFRWIYENIKFALDINPTLKIIILPKFKELVVYLFVRLERFFKN
jgi:hypothetical protein